MDIWECRICGYKFEGEEPPARCPLCDAPDTDFVRITSKVRPMKFKKVEQPRGSDLLQKFVEASLARKGGEGPQSHEAPQKKAETRPASVGGDEFGAVSQEIADALALAFDVLTAAHALSTTEWLDHSTILWEEGVRLIRALVEKRTQELKDRGADPLALVPYLKDKEELPLHLRLYLARIHREVSG